MKRLILTALTVSTLGGCAAQMEDLRARSANDSFTVGASLECLYTQGVEHTAGVTRWSEPPFTSFINQQTGTAWFRQPLTLVELRQVSDHVTRVTRKQTGSAEAFGQANDLLQFLRANPCGAAS